MTPRYGRWLQLLFPSCIWSIPGPSVHLTFDDGPHPEATPAVLKVLDRFALKATFFLLGGAVHRYPALAREIAERGHRIGIHGYGHSRLIGLSKSSTVSEIRRTEEALEGAGIHSSKFFRPPYGFVTWNTVRAARATGYRVMMWSYLTGDFRRTTDERFVEHLKTHVSPGGILVYHDNNLTAPRIGLLLTLSIEAIQSSGFAIQPFP